MGKQTKQFKADFYEVSLLDNEKNMFADFLKECDECSEALVITNGDDEKFQIRNIESVNQGNAYKAIFGRCREGRSLVQGSEKGDEADLELKPGYTLVEKNHFLYYPTENLIIFQRNSSGSHYSKLQKYLNLAMNVGTLSLEPILTENSYEKILSNQAMAKRIELSVAKPKNAHLYEHITQKEMIKILGDSGGLRARISISMGRSSGTLVSDMKNTVVAFAKSGLASVAKVQLEGDSEPIDLIADRIVETMHIELDDNRRPIAGSVYHSLDRAKVRRQDDLNTFFGK